MLQGRKNTLWCCMHGLKFKYHLTCFQELTAAFSWKEIQYIKNLMFIRYPYRLSMDYERFNNSLDKSVKEKQSCTDGYDEDPMIV